MINNKSYLVDKMQVRLKKIEKKYCTPLGFEPTSILVASTGYIASFFTNKHLEPNNGRHLRNVGIISRF